MTNEPATTPSTTAAPSITSALHSGLDTVDAVIGRVPDDAWSAPSPCDGWTVSEVLGHITGTMSKAYGLIADDSAHASVPAEPATEPSASRRREDWQAAADRVHTALADADLDRQVSGPRGPSSLGDALALPTADLAVHAWDIAAGAGVRHELPAELLTQVHRVVDAIPQETLRRPGLSGPAQPAPDDATQTE